MVIIEPELSLARLTRSVLTMPEREVAFATTLRDGLGRIGELLPEVVLTERLTDDEKSIQRILEFVQERELNTTLLVWSRQHDSLWKIPLLEMGVDLCLDKPISSLELQFQVRRCEQWKKVTVRADHRLPILDLRSGMLQVLDTVYQLRRQESRVLSCLMHHCPKLVSRKTLTEWVWPTREIDPERVTLDVYIRRLRLQLAQMGGEIITARGYGYRLDWSGLKV
jgi:DNA-binding response OmpR family regulator